MTEIGRHSFVLVSEDDPEATEVCTRCGAQRNRQGPIAERAKISGGWPTEDCTTATHEGEGR